MEADDIKLEEIGQLMSKQQMDSPSYDRLPSNLLKQPSVESLGARRIRIRSESQNSVAIAAAAAAQQAPTQQSLYVDASRSTAARSARTRASFVQQHTAAGFRCSGACSLIGRAARAVYSSLTGFGSGIDNAVAADYGTGVGAFFTIFRQCSLGAFISACLLLLFVTLPQAGWGDRQHLVVNNVTVAAALVGQDIRPQLLLYYGAYSNETLLPSNYSLSDAYFFVSLTFLVFNVVFIAKMLTTAVQHHYVRSSGELHGSNLLATVFSAWDFSMRSGRAVRQRRAAVVANCREILSHISKKQQRSVADRASSLLQVVVINFLSLVFIVTDIALLFVMFRDDLYGRAQQHLGGTNLTPGSRAYCILAVVLFHVVLLALKLFGLTERHSQLHFNVTYPLIRNGIFTLLVVCLLVFQIYSLVYCHSSLADAESITCQLMGRTYATDGWTSDSDENFFCWESWVAAQLYRLNLYNLYTTIVSSLCIEVLPKLITLLPIARLRQSISLHIDLGYNLATLTFPMALFWLSAFFSPPTAVFAAFKLLLLFFYKWLILYLCFTPSLVGIGKELTAKRIMWTLLLILATVCLFLLFVFESLPMSAGCGPFRHGRLLKDIFFIQSALPKLLELVTHGVVQLLLMCIFLTVLVRLHSVAQGKNDLITALRRYIVLEHEECVRLNKRINARLRRQAELLVRSQRRQYY